MKELMTALSRAQAEIKPIERNADNPFYKSSYSDLSAVSRYLMPILSKNGLCVIQKTAISADGKMVLETVLGHNSGESISSQYILIPVKADPQGWLSCITYARRASLMGIVGAVQAGEDDDGNEAAGNKAPVEPKPAKTSYKADEPTATGKTISEKQGKLLWAKAKAQGMTEAELKALVKGIANVDHSKDIPAGKMDLILKGIDGWQPGAIDETEDDLPY